MASSKSAKRMSGRSFKAAALGMMVMGLLLMGVSSDIGEES